MGLQVFKCPACGIYKPITEFDKRTHGLKMLIDPVCRKCRLAGRAPIEELLSRKHAGGRNKIPLPLGKIKELHENGYGYKAIRTELRKLGYEVSYSTIARRIAK
jgi:hypothetical protein